MSKKARESERQPTRGRLSVARMTEPTEATIPVKVGPGIWIMVTPEAAEWMRKAARELQSRKMRAICRRDWDEALGLMRKPNRLPAIARWFDRGRLTPAELNTLLSAWWNDGEGWSAFPQDHWYWLRLFRAAGFVTDAGEDMGGGKVAGELSAGDQLTIYRGQEATHAPGLSWTLDRDKAGWFARRSAKGSPVVLTGRVGRANVLGYFESRGESEIVVDPINVEITGTEAAAVTERRAARQKPSAPGENGPSCPDEPENEYLPTPPEQNRLRAPHGPGRASEPGPSAAQTPAERDPEATGRPERTDRP